VHGKNDFSEISKKLNTDKIFCSNILLLKIILSNYQTNYVGRSN